MFRIDFFDSNNVLICTHSIIGNKMCPTIFAVDNYCEIIAKYYTCVHRWKIFDDSGKLLLSARMD